MDPTVADIVMSLENDAGDVDYNAALSYRFWQWLSRLCGSGNTNQESVFDARFKHQVPMCPVGQRPVMIGRRKRAYDTLDKVMKRLDLIMNTISAMNFIVIDIQ